MATSSSSAEASSSSSTDDHDPWQIAKSRFLADLEPQERDLFNHATLENLFYASSNANREDSESSKLRSATRKLGPLCATIESFGKPFDVFSSIQPLYIAPIWGSMRVVLVLARSYGRFFDRIVDVFERIGDILPRFRDYERIYDGVKHQRLTQALSKAYLEIILFCTQTREVLKQQKNSKFRRLVKPFSLDEEFDGALARFRQHKSNVKYEADTCHQIEAAEERKAQLILRTAERRAKALARLSIIHCTRRHHTLVEKRHEGTGTWLQSLEAYIQWKASKTTAVLCGYGIPGSGKSVLTSTVVDSLQEHGSICFYYCDYTDKRSLEPCNVFGTLVRQILDKIDPLPENLLVAIEQAEHDGVQMTQIDTVVGLLKEVLRLACSSHPSFPILLDGIDEVSDQLQEIIFNHLGKILTMKDIVLKLFITCREDLRSQFEKFLPNLTSAFSMMGETVDLDIGAFIKSSVRSRIIDRSIVVRDPDLETVITEKLIQGARGMFLWVEFQLQDLALQESDYGIRHVLDHLPKSLSETYARLLSRIEGADRREFVLRMFKWLVAARQPLQVDEMKDAIAFSLEDREWDRRKIPTDFKRLVRACGNLVLVESGTHVVTFAHYTVQNYLIAQDHNGFFHFTAHKANETAADTCLAYLNFTNFDTAITKYKEDARTELVALNRIAGDGPILSPDQPGRTLAMTWHSIRTRKQLVPRLNMGRLLSSTPSTFDTEPFPLLSYAIAHWLFHTRNLCLDEQGHEEVQNLHTSRRKFLFSDLVFTKDLPFKFLPWPSFAEIDTETMIFAMLGWASASNHISLVDLLLERSKTPLHKLIENNWSALIFDHDQYCFGPAISLEKWLKMNQSAVFISARYAQEGLFPALTIRSIVAEPTLESICQSETPHLMWLHTKLQYCCRNGHLEILERCVHSEMNLPFCDVMLVEAVRYGQLRVVQFFYAFRKASRGQTVKIGDEMCDLIDVAVFGGHQDIIRFFLSAGSTVNYYRYRLFLLAEIAKSNYERIIKLLRLFEVLAIPSGLYAQIVSDIVVAGNRKVLELVLPHILQQGSCDKFSIDPYYLAVCCPDKTEIIQCLTDHDFPGLDFNTASSHSFLWSLSAMPGDLRVNYSHPTALYRACFMGDLHMVQRLVASGANPSARSPTAHFPMLLREFREGVFAQDLMMWYGVKQGLNCTLTIPIHLDNFLNSTLTIPIHWNNLQLARWQYPIAAAFLQEHDHVVDWLLREELCSFEIFLVHSGEGCDEIEDIDVLAGSRRGPVYRVLNEREEKAIHGDMLSASLNAAPRLDVIDLWSFLSAGASVENLYDGPEAIFEFALEKKFYILASLIASRKLDIVDKITIPVAVNPSDKWSDLLHVEFLAALKTVYRSGKLQLPPQKYIQAGFTGSLTFTEMLEFTDQHVGDDISDNHWHSREYVQFILIFITDLFTWNSGLLPWLELIDWCIDLIQKAFSFDPSGWNQFIHFLLEIDEGAFYDALLFAILAFDTEVESSYKVNLITSLGRKSESFNCTDPNGTTLLANVAKCDSKVIASLLILYGADPI